MRISDDSLRRCGREQRFLARWPGSAFALVPAVRSG
jgi:hypothetical protein